MKNVINCTKAKNSTNAITTAYLKLFKVWGIGNVSVTRVCQEAGVDRGTFYNHYYNIQDLHDDIILGFVGRLLAEVAAIDYSSLCEDSFVPFFNILFEHSDTTGAIISAMTREEFQTIFNRVSGNGVAQAVESAFSFLTASDVETYLFLMFRGSAFIALKELMKPRMNMNLLSATLFEYSILVLNYLGCKNGYDETELRGGVEEEKNRF